MISIPELQTGSAKFSIGQAISDGWKLVNKHLGYYIVGGILTLLIAGSVNMVPYAGEIANTIIVSPCFAASAVFITWRISKGIPWTDFGDLFKGFNFLTPVAIGALIQTTVIIGLILIFIFSYLPQMKDIYDLLKDADSYNNRDAIEALFRQTFDSKSLLLFSLLLLTAFFTYIIWAFKNHFIVIYEMQAWPAMEMSRKIAIRNLLQLVGLFLLLGLIVFVSALFCGIGLLFSLPLSIGAVYSAFAQITQCDSVEIDNEMFDFIADEKV